MPILM